jgi:hypothetical protein
VLSSFQSSCEAELDMRVRVVERIDQI